MKDIGNLFMDFDNLENGKDELSKASSEEEI